MDYVPNSPIRQPCLLALDPYAIFFLLKHFPDTRCAYLMPLLMDKNMCAQFEIFVKFVGSTLNGKKTYNE